VKFPFTRSGAGGVRSICERRVERAFLLRPPHPNTARLIASDELRAFSGAPHAQRFLNSKCILGAP
jgi:hypothetical protein